MSASSLPSARLLRRQLKQLKAKERHVRGVRRGLKAAAGGWDFHGESYSAEAAWDAAHEHQPDYQKLIRPDAFPGNPELERALADFHASNRDPRPRLDVVRSIYSSVVFSIASPVGAWDALDLKPQPFALGQYLALPVFSSLPYLQSFCHRFGHSVRGPNGALWGSPDAPGVAPKRLHAAARPSAAKRKSKQKKGTARKKQQQADAASRRAAQDEGHRRELGALDAAADVERFDFSAAVPLPVHGPFDHPFLFGYFGAAATVLENSHGIPGDVDLVLNPASPLELVLGSETTRYLLRRDGIIERCMRDVDRVVRAELARFFQRHCPEVMAARSVIYPRPGPPDAPPEQTQFDLVVAVRSQDFAATMQRLSHAKATGDLVGHDSMSLVPHTQLPAHMDAGSSVFYDVEARWADQLARRGGSGSGGLQPMVPDETHLVDSQGTGWGGPLGDIGMAYTEAHAVFTHEHNIRRKVRSRALEEEDDDDDSTADADTDAGRDAPPAAPDNTSGTQG
jgi:hypothetical protein